LLVSVVKTSGLLGPSHANEAPDTVMKHGLFILSPSG